MIWLCERIQSWRNNKIKCVLITCKKKDMLLVNYEAPDGSRKHKRLWNGGNGRGVIKLYKRSHKELELIDEVIATHVGCEYGEYEDTKLSQ